MGNRAQRFGITIGRGWVVLFLIAGALLLGAYWIGPLRSPPAQLELLAIAGDRAVEVFAAAPRRTADGRIVFPVPLAVRNVGARTARPRSVVLSVPAQFQLATTRGRIPGDVNPGLPLRRYVIPLPRTALEPSATTDILPGLDTIYLEPDLPRYYCTTQGADIPEFNAAPKYNAQTLSSMRIFYSFNDAAGPERQTGLLTVNVDPALLDVAPAAAPPTFRMTVQEPQVPAPEVGVLSFSGARTAHCGDPEQPTELYTVLWETRGGGRLFVVYVNDVGRKRLYDLNRDGIIELETWDSDANGMFEARREARFAIPAFLMPLPPRDPRMAQPDPVRPDSAWLALFHSPGQGPDRFADSGLSPHPPVAAIDTVRPDSASAAEMGPVAAPPTYADLGPVPPATPEFLALFANTDAGPFRFSRRPAPAAAASPRPLPGPLPGRTRPPATAQAPTPPDSAAAAAAAAAAEEVEEEPEAPRPRRRREPLGTPIIPPR